MADGQSSLRVLRDRRFGPYIGANFTSNIGNWFQNVAASIVVFRVTGSNTLVGTVSVLQFLATLLLTKRLFSGLACYRLNVRQLDCVAAQICPKGYQRRPYELAPAH